MLSFCGIDVSKDRLDAMVLPDEQCSSVPNDAAGWAALVEQLRGCSVTAIGIEASGGTSAVSYALCTLLACPCARSIRSGWGGKKIKQGLDEVP
jgi:transposase